MPDAPREPDVRLGPLTFQYDAGRCAVYVAYRDGSKGMLEHVPAEDWAEFAHAVRTAVDALNGQLVPEALRAVVRDEVMHALNGFEPCRYGADY